MLQYLYWVFPCVLVTTWANKPEKEVNGAGVCTYVGQFDTLVGMLSHRFWEMHTQSSMQNKCWKLWLLGEALKYILSN